ncbi:hypothetical protein [Flagellimonas sp.]|uniref:hypothetical protein n=1 Tax=Flagellimonas sp. TaxID=2058762 RepID=UPI003B5151B3
MFKNTIILYVGLLFLISYQLKAQDNIPKVTFNYNFIPFDRTCARITNVEIEETWIKELHENLDKFRQAWGALGPQLLAKTVQKTGRPFKQKELHAAMSLCDINSMSHPLLINMRRFLYTSTDNKPEFLDFFVALVFHELMHIYVYDIRSEIGTTPLLEKYQREKISVINHLHLVALIKNAYIQLGMEPFLEKLIEEDSKLGPIYARSWEIVNELEDYRHFIDELKLKN